MYWAAWTLCVDNRELLQKMRPILHAQPVYRHGRGGWLMGGCQQTARRRPIQYKIPLKLVGGRVWISRWVGAKRSKLAPGMDLPAAIAMDLEGLDTLDQVEKWFRDRGVLGEQVAGSTEKYTLDRLEVETRLASSNHRIRVSRKDASGAMTQATVEYRLYWEETRFYWERRVVVGLDIVEIFDEETANKHSDRRMIIQMLESMAGINAS